MLLDTVKPRVAPGATLRFETTIGPMAAGVRGGSVVALEFVDGATDDVGGAASGEARATKREETLLARVERQVTEYFRGKRREFDLPLAPEGTEFRRAVWDALMAIPFGGTEAYSTVARRVGRPSAVRAVAQAIGANPIGVVIPCHRVVGADGSLTGYAGGLDRKQVLLEHEEAIAGGSLFKR